jgi:hypothetical protein
MGGMTNEYRILVGKPEGNSPPRHTQEYNIRMYLETGWEVVEWIHLDGNKWLALVSMIMNLPFPLKAGNFLTSLISISFSRILLHGICYSKHQSLHEIHSVYKK